jgi:hypothetical protein
VKDPMEGVRRQTVIPEKEDWAVACASGNDRVRKITPTFIDGINLDTIPCVV